MLISTQKPPAKKQSQLGGEMRNRVSGFSLIELLVVIALIALITMLALPGISSYFQVSIHAASREIASVIKEAYNATMITGNVHRVVFNISEGEYWVESGPRSILLDTRESKEKAEKLKKFSTSIVSSSSGESQFQMDKTVTRKKLSLPTGVKFEDVLSEKTPQPIETGMAYAHFFPNGMSEQTAIHLSDKSKHKMTLAITALLGQTDLYERYATATEVFEE